MHVVLAALLLTAASPLSERAWDVGGVTRSALVAVPEGLTSEKPPVVFVFHGHGGNSRNAARSFHIHELWAEAIVVYPQGLPTPGRLTDPEGKRNGWQHAAGEQADRDLLFFDTMLESLKSDHNIDENRVYSTGHSNGGGFTYLLWSERADMLAAVAPSSSAANRRLKQGTPLPALHIAGESDPLVKFDMQQLTMTAVRRLNGCDDTGTAWAENAVLYPSATGTPLVTLIHPGGHKFYADAPPLIVRFFKEHERQTGR